MASGCEFMCENKDCKQYKNGIVVTAPWPLGDIDRIISCSNIFKNKEFQDGLRKLRDQGRKYACLIFPNIDEIPTAGFRVHMWCDKCPCLWSYDAMLSIETVNMEDAIQKAKIPENCPTCESKLKTVNELLDEKDGGIICPSCKVKMKSHPWFSNEEEEKHGKH